MRNKFSILTPENVYIEYELAGVGSRFVSAFVDHLIQIIIIVILYIPVFLVTDYVENITLFNVISLYYAILFILITIIVFGYFIFFDIVFKGQSPGKILLGLKVIKENGNQIEFMDSFLRNIIRAAYLIPVLYVVEGLLVIFSSKNKRIGDYLSNTVVIILANRNLKSKIILLQNVEDNYLHDSNRNEKVSFRINDDEYRILKDFISRYSDLNSENNELQVKLKKYFARKFEVEVRDKDSYIFLREIYRVGIIG